MTGKSLSKKKLRLNFAQMVLLYLQEHPLGDRIDAPGFKEPEERFLFFDASAKFAH